MSAFFSVSRRVSAMISAMASSTTLRVLENGALNTVTPRSEAAARSIWFVPMQNAPIATRSGAASSTRAVTWVLDRMPSSATPGKRGDQFVLVQGPVDRFDLEPGRAQDLARRRGGSARAAKRSSASALEQCYGLGSVENPVAYPPTACPSQATETGPLGSAPWIKTRCG